jgi:YidC/Oxa1 family membrane protein insertase
MNKNNLTGILLIGAIFVAWSLWMTPSKEEQKTKQRRDSIAKVQQRQRVLSDSVMQLKAEQQSITSAKAENSSIEFTGSQEVDRSKYGVFANSSVGEEKIIEVESDRLKLKFSNKGGRILSVEIKDYRTFDSLPLVLFDSNSANKFGLVFFQGRQDINTQNLYFQPFFKNKVQEGQSKFTVGTDEEFSFGLRLYVDADKTSYDPSKYIEYLYTIKGDEYMVDYTINFVGLKDLISPQYNNLNLEWVMHMRRQEKSIDRYNGPTIYYKYYEDDVDYLSETSDDEEDLKTNVKWVSYKQHFFSTSLIAKNNFDNAKIKTFTDPKFEEEGRYLKTMYSEIGIPYQYGIDQSIPMSFYFGPNKFSDLRQYKLDLERQIPLGWSLFILSWINIYAVIPVFNFLGGFGWNYGIIILILTILLKIFLFPIAYKTYKSTAKMRVLKPEIDEIGKKFPKKEDAMKKQQATMGLYKKAGVNPMAGCVPMLLQMPILFAMFRFFPSSIELRQQSFLWATDLSSYDSIWTFPNGFEIPFYGDHISLFTLLMTVSTIFYTKINNQMMASNQQMPGMKTMMYLMPIMFLGIFNNYASGLSYYYFLANIITFGQMYLIRKSIDEKKILAQIELNKKKKTKKSGFQKRLEEAAKKRGMNPPKRK